MFAGYQRGKGPDARGPGGRHMGQDLEFFHDDIRVILKRARQCPTGKMAADSNDGMKVGDGFHIAVPFINKIPAVSVIVVQKL